jgi:putative addiction module component (TIGR02574 family)
MTRAARQLLDEALSLPEDERAALATELLASLDGPADAGWEASWLAEIDRRVSAARQRGIPASEWADVRSRILAKLTAL